jgi:exonuclease III
MGLPHLHVVGQKGYHGVAFASRLKLEPGDAPDLCHKKEARAAAVKVGGIEIHNLYVPAGADIPDPEVNEKFAHKLDVLARMKTEYAKRKAAGPLLVVGDLNVAPGEHDVWSHKQLLNVVSHTPVETEAGTALYVVELSQSGLDKEQSRPAARSPLGVARRGGGIARVYNSRSRPLVGAAERPRASRDRTKSLGHNCRR